MVGDEEAVVHPDADTQADRAVVDEGEAVGLGGGEGGDVGAEDGLDFVPALGGGEVEPGGADGRTGPAGGIEDANGEEQAVRGFAVEGVGGESVGQADEVVPGVGAVGGPQEITRLPVAGREPTRMVLSWRRGN